MSSYEEIITVAENLVIGVTEGLKEMGDVAAELIENLQNVMKNHQKDYEQTINEITTKYGVVPGEIQFELADNSSDLEAIDFEKDLIAFNIKAEDKYYGQVLLSQNTYDAHTHEGLGKEVNEMTEDMAYVLGNENLAMEAAKEANEYKSEKVPERENLKDAGFSDKEADEVTLESHNEAIKKGDIRALKAERAKLINERNKAYKELSECIGKGKLEEATSEKIIELNKEIDSKTAEIEIASKTRKEQIKENIKGAIKTKVYAGLNAIKNSTLALNTSTMFIKRGQDVKTALAHLDNSYKSIQRKMYAVEYAIQMQKVKQLTKERNNAAIKMIKKNNTKANLKALFTGKRADYTNAFTKKQENKLAKYDAEIKECMKGVNGIEAKLASINEVQKERIEKIQAERNAMGRKRAAGLDEVAGKVNEFTDAHKAKKDKTINDINGKNDKLAEKYKEMTGGRDLANDIGRAVNSANQRNAANPKKDAPKKEDLVK